MLDFRIETFLEVCKCMNYTKAAANLNITQPAVSQHIHYLEKEYHQQLFTYEGKKLQLTEAGKILYQAAVSMKSDISLLKETMQQSLDQKMELSIGATLTIGEFVMANQMKHLKDCFPSANFILTVANTAELIHKLRNNEIQFALVEGSFSNKDFDSITYSTERFIPVCAGNHKFHGSAPKRLQDLTTECIIAREQGSGNRDILDSFLHLQNLAITDFSHYIEVNGIHAIKSLVQADCGIAFLYEIAVKKELELGTIKEIPLKDFNVSHKFSFIWNKNSIYGTTYQDICQKIVGVDAL